MPITSAKAQSPARQALLFARRTARATKSWVELYNALFGIGGRLGELFPTPGDRTAFAKTPEYREIMSLLEQAQQSSGASRHTEASGTFIVRVPKSLHTALQAEAEAEGVSMNQLCVAKLSMQLRALV